MPDTADQLYPLHQARPPEARAASGRPQRRTLDRMARALGALALGWVAQLFFAADQLWPGLLLYAVAIPLFAFQVLDAGREEQGRLSLDPHLLQLRVRTGIPGWLGLAGMVSAVLLSALSWRLFGVETRGEAAWLAYLASLLLFGVGAWLAEERSLSPAPSHSPSGVEGVAALPARKRTFLSLPVPGEVDYWLTTILLLAIFVRLFRFFALPFGTWYDEATTGLEARRILEDPAFRPAFSMAMNQVAHHLYLAALSFRLLGDTTAALRAVSVLFGVAGVLAAYLFGREYGGRRWGLLLAFLIATMRWHINFSRIGMNGVDAPFFEFLTLYLALRVVRARPGPLRALAWLGLAVGLGLCFYTPFRLFSLVLAAFGVALLVRLFSRRVTTATSSAQPESGDIAWGKLRPRLVSGLGLLLLAVWLAATPATQYAWRHGDSFWGRARHVSILQNRDDPNLLRAVAQNTQKHLLMFNYKGDSNGRHNLPGAPTLDRLSAVLFALGLGLAVARRKPFNLLFLALLAAGLLGGILTLDFEAPQSLRSIGAVPAVAYFIALSLDALWCELRRAARITRPRYSLAPVILGLGLIGISNASTYFGPQAHTESVWREFSTAETLVGKRMAELDPDVISYASPFFYDHAAIRFHAPLQATPDRHKVIPLPDPLPVREPPDRAVAYFIHPDEEWIFSLAREMYPTAHFEVLPEEGNYAPAVYVVYLEPGQVASVQGLEARYWPGAEPDGPPARMARAPLLDATWPADAPLPLPFTAEWSGVLYAPEYGDYVLGMEAPGEIQVELDGDRFTRTGSLSVTRLLAEGNHALHIHAQGGSGPLRLWWQPPGEEQATVPMWALFSPPVSANGLLGEYYPNSDWQGAPALERVDPTLNVYFHLTPLPRPYSVEWTGTLVVPQSGIYGLGVRAVDEARLYLDGQMLVSAGPPGDYVEQLAELRAGPHELRITYQDLAGHSRIHLYWTWPDGRREIIPAGYLWPGKVSPPPAQAAPVLAQELPPLQLQWKATWGGPGHFLEPRDVAVVGESVYVADTGNRRVQVLDREGSVINSWTGVDETFEEPLALGVDSQDRLLVLDSPAGWIYRFGPDGQRQGRIAGPAIQSYHPRGMAALPDGRILVADTGGGRILFLDQEGNVSGYIGGPGAAPGQFGEPTDVASDDMGTYYVVEAYNQRLQRIDRQGRTLGHWPIPSSIAFDGPHIDWALDGSLLMSAPEEGAILRYGPDGRLLGRWSQAGPAPLCRPVGLTVDQATGTLYVTDTACHNVVLFQLE